MSRRSDQVNRNAGAQIKKLMANLDAADDDAIVQAITTKLILAQFSAGEAKSHRLDAGRMLLVLRARIEAKDENWWKWYHVHFTRCRRDAEKVMAMASAADPEAAAEEERTKRRTGMARSRAAAHVGRNGASRRSSGNVVNLKQAATIKAIMSMIRDDLNDDGRDALLAEIMEEFYAEAKTGDKDRHHDEIQGPHHARGH